MDHIASVNDFILEITSHNLFFYQLNLKKQLVLGQLMHKELKINLPKSGIPVINAMIDKILEKSKLLWGSSR